MNTAPPPGSSLTNLKRSRSGGLHPTASSSSPLPPLPKIRTELILQVYTHKSLRRSGDGSNAEEYGDNERLSELGQQVLDATVTHTLFRRRPFLEAGKLRHEREEILSDSNIEDWVARYGMKTKLRCHPDAIPSLSRPEESRSIFCAYVGGVYAESGVKVVQGWMDRLLAPIAEVHPTSPEPYMVLPPEARPPSKRMKSEQPASPPSTSLPIFFGSQPPPSPVRQPPPHIVKHLPNPLAPAQPTLPFLPLFNQTASQRRVTVDYPAECSGPPHAPQWTVQCIVNGIPKGIGRGGTKQFAKEEAARQAFYAMGWT